MVVAKRQGREKPVKIEQEVKQTALLASPIYRGQARGGGHSLLAQFTEDRPRVGCGGEKHIKRGAKTSLLS